MSDDFDNTPVLLWQMGKVGSTSIWNALNELGLSPIQLHVLDPVRINRIIEEHEERGFSTPDHILDARRVQSLIANPDEKFRIVSLVRDPVARNLSALFESWDVYPPSCAEADNPAKLAEWFVMNFDYSVLNWFDHEINSKVSINIYDHNFDHGKKRLIIENDHFEILILRSEDNQSVKEKNLKEFFNISNIKLGFANTSYSKPRNETWKLMRNCCKISSIMSDIVYQSKMVRHFYSEQEVEDFRIRWAPSQDGIYFQS